MERKITIRKIEFVTHDVLRLLTDKPENYNFKPGQATELSINKPDLKDEKRPFTFTSLPKDKELEFTIKVYPEHDGVTEQMLNLKVGEALLIGEPWGTINYSGPGTFIAAGAGITPFISILKDLKSKNELKDQKLIFANKSKKDIIYQSNLETWLEDDFNVILSDVDTEKYSHGHIDKAYLESKNVDVTKKVYLCGPPEMMDEVSAHLFAMGLKKDHLIKEDFA